MRYEAREQELWKVNWCSKHYQVYVCVIACLPDLWLRHQFISSSLCRHDMPSLRKKKNRSRHTRGNLFVAVLIDLFHSCLCYARRTKQLSFSSFFIGLTSQKAKFRRKKITSNGPHAEQPVFVKWRKNSLCFKIPWVLWGIKCSLRWDARGKNWLNGITPCKNLAKKWHLC